MWNAPHLFTRVTTLLVLPRHMTSRAKTGNVQENEGEVGTLPLPKPWDSEL